ncbi:MAG: SprT family zinc-dependent metalloprotease [Candidatus Omnitrophica bacterium]|nr:SprT family zinc-dependent metalloprotease [Candidatus Omnitrophota bacterium]
MEEIKVSRIIRSKRRTLALIITADAGLEVRAPFALSENAIMDFIRKKSSWILKNQQMVRGRNKKIVPGHLIGWYKAQALEKISERCRFYAGVTGFEYKVVRISNAVKRWGSCSPSGRLNFSWRLAMAPLEVIDYVVIHEIMHLSERNHSRRFWDKVEAVLPGYKKCESWLRMNGYLLTL